MRQFLAVELPAERRAAMVAARRVLSDQEPSWRWVDIGGLHLTLRFLGEVGEELDARSRPVWRRAAATSAVFAARIAGSGTFPVRGEARVLWAGVEDDPPGSAARLAGAVESAARTLGFEPQRRRFRPHITLARARRGRRPTRPATELAVSRSSFTVSEVVLFRSELLPAGARYTALERFSLGGGEES